MTQEGITKCLHGPTTEYGFIDEETADYLPTTKEARAKIHSPGMLYQFQGNGKAATSL
jgi:hypothetical protein